MDWPGSKPSKHMVHSGGRRVSSRVPVRLRIDATKDVSDSAPAASDRSMSETPTFVRTGDVLRAISLSEVFVISIDTDGLSSSDCVVAASSSRAGAEGVGDDEESRAADNMAWISLMLSPSSSVRWNRLDDASSFLFSGVMFVSWPCIAAAAAAFPFPAAAAVAVSSSESSEASGLFRTQRITIRMKIITIRITWANIDG
mmetsp:Transcript_4449/g.8676  ORF Transcript_4449/g.8676 Transcript_4449/m.8676 type:complete len:200 (+) Transcript_4449:273-872(+)